MQLGVEIDMLAGEGGESGNRLRLHAATITSREAPYDLVRKMRATFNVLGPLLAREGEARVSLPGGCAIGARPVNLHLEALQSLGAELELESGYVQARAPRGLKGARINFPMVSVGATEHTLLAASLADGESQLVNAACEPEIVDLAQCLSAMGAHIEGAGTPTITVHGVERLHAGEHAIMADRIEAGAYAMAIAGCGGEAVLERARADHLPGLIDAMETAGVDVSTTDEGLWIRSSGERPRAVDIVTAPFPGFATDLQAPFMAFMTKSQGTACIEETIFENRFMHVPELARLGAHIDISGRVAHVRGVTHLKGAPVMATDLRASIALVVAGLMAEGETLVNRIYHLDRGFEHLEEKLTRLGADVERVAGETP
jgi:UDP-N-acetylglucosamine 1-carboxyvinyltransferase